LKTASIFLLSSLLISLSGLEYREGKTTIRSTAQRASTYLSEWKIRQDSLFDIHQGYLETAVEASIRLQSSQNLILPSGAGAGVNPATAFEIKDLDWNGGGSLNARLRLDRFSYSKDFGPYTFTLGRQAITLGKGNSFSVLDVLNPFSPQSLDATYKPGIDALRIEKIMGDTGGMEIIITSGSNQGRENIISKYRKLMGRVDTELILGEFRQRKMAGLSLEGEISDLGILTELGLIERDMRSDAYFNGGGNYALAAVLGLSKRLSSEDTVSLSYLYHELGAKNLIQLNQSFLHGPLVDKWLWNSSRQYLRFSLIKKLDSLKTLLSSLQYNLEDESVFFQPGISYNLASDLDLSVFAWKGFGKQSQITRAGVIRQSEFGDIGLGIGLFIKWVF